ncbi:MAG: nitroreductase family protein [Bacteroidota bacterium]
MEKNTNNQHPIHNLIVKRWSSRSFDLQKQISANDINSLVEAARWAPSSYNDQPWRFFIAHRNDSKFELITKSLGEFNQLWAPFASTYIVVVGQTKRDDGSPNAACAYDCGQAVAYLTMEATDRGIMMHQMGGFDKKQLHSDLQLHEDLDVLIVIAVGYQGENDQLHENIKGLENAPRVRKSQEEILL